MTQRANPFRSTPFRSAPAIAFLLLLAVLSFARLAHSQRVEGSGLKFPEYFDPPNERQLKTLVQGGKAQPLEGGRVLFTDARVQTWRTNGEPEMEISAAECVYDPKLKAITSPGAIRVGTADGNFAITGEGFVWQQTNATFVISNRVRTLVQPALLRAAATNSNSGVLAPGTGDLANAPLEITSDQFEFGKETGVGTYRGHVHAAGTNLSVSAGIITTIVPLGEHKLDRILAEQDVTIRYEDLEAAGQRAEYDALHGFARLTGKPTWRAGRREGRADLLTMDASNRVFRAEGQAWARLPAEGAGGGGFLPGAGQLAAEAPAAPTTNAVVEIHCASYELRTNSATFNTDVRVEERDGSLLKATMTCADLLARFAGTNQLENLEATGGVVIESEDSHLAGRSATYTATNGLLEMAGDPSWRIGTRAGRGDQIFLNTMKNEVLVRGHASMRLPADQVALTPPPRPGAPRAPEAPKQPAGPAFADLYADEYRADRTTARFTGNVRMVHPRLNWTCERVMVQLPAAGGAGRIEYMLAEDSVVFDLSDGVRSMHGTGQKAVYNYKATGLATNELLELSGDPVLSSTNGTTFRNPIILLDMTHNRIAAPGPYQIRGFAPKTPTNFLQFPKR